MQLHTNRSNSGLFISLSHINNLVGILFIIFFFFSLSPILCPSCNMTTLKSEENLACLFNFHTSTNRKVMIVVFFCLQLKHIHRKHTYLAKSKSGHSSKWEKSDYIARKHLNTYSYLYWSKHLYNWKLRKTKTSMKTDRSAEYVSKSVL